MLPMSEAEVDAQAQAVEATQPETVTLLAVTLESNGAGGAREVVAAIGTTTGSIARPSSAERKIAEALGVTNALTVVVPRGTAISAAQRLQVAGRTYDITSVPPEETWSTGIRVLCREVVLYAAS